MFAKTDVEVSGFYSFMPDQANRPMLNKIQSMIGPLIYAHKYLVPTAMGLLSKYDNKTVLILFSTDIENNMKPLDFSVLIRKTSTRKHINLRFHCNPPSTFL